MMGRWHHQIWLARAMVDWRTVVRQIWWTESSLHPAICVGRGCGRGGQDRRGERGGEGGRVTAPPNSIDAGDGGLAVVVPVDGGDIDIMSGRGRIGRGYGRNSERGDRDGQAQPPLPLVTPPILSALWAEETNPLSDDSSGRKMLVLS